MVERIIKWSKDAFILLGSPLWLLKVKETIGTWQERSVKGWQSISVFSTTVVHLHFSMITIFVLFLPFLLHTNSITWLFTILYVCLIDIVVYLPLLNVCLCVCQHVFVRLSACFSPSAYLEPAQKVESKKPQWPWCRSGGLVRLGPFSGTCKQIYFFAFNFVFGWVGAR